MHVLQYLLLTSMCNSLPISFSHNDGNPRFSIIAVFMGSFAATAIYYDCDVWDGFHDSLPSLHPVSSLPLLKPLTLEAAVTTTPQCYAQIVQNLSRIGLLRCSYFLPAGCGLHLWLICPHTAARLHSHQRYPLRSFCFFGCFQGDGVVAP